LDERDGHISESLADLIRDCGGRDLSSRVKPRDKED